MYYENTYIVIPVQKYVSHYVLNKSCCGILFLFMFFLVPLFLIIYLLEKKSNLILYLQEKKFNKSCFGIFFMFFFSSFISYNISTGEEIQSYNISTGEEIKTKKQS